MDIILKKIFSKKIKNSLKKKAVLFSLISVLFSVLFITLFSMEFTSFAQDKVPGTNIRIRVLDVYGRNFENYVKDSISVSSYRTLESMTILAGQGNFYASQNVFETTFKNCMICGTTDCASGQVCPIGEIGYDLNSRIAVISNLAESQLNIDTDYVIHDVDISQIYPFEVQITVNISYNITDNSSDQYAVWTKNSVITQSVNIQGLKDPLAHINSDGTYNVTISKYSGACEFNETCWNIGNFTEFFTQKTYRYYENGPGFLQRYWNDKSASSCCGIEHVLHSSYMGSNIDFNNSFIDNYYWNASHTCPDNPVTILNLTIGTERISLDEPSAVRYRIISSTNRICPE